MTMTADSTDMYKIVTEYPELVARREPETSSGIGYWDEVYEVVVRRTTTIEQDGAWDADSALESIDEPELSRSDVGRALLDGDASVSWTEDRNKRVSQD